MDPQQLLQLSRTRADPDLAEVVTVLALPDLKRDEFRLRRRTTFSLAPRAGRGRGGGGLSTRSDSRIGPLTRNSRSEFRPLPASGARGTRCLRRFNSKPSIHHTHRPRAGT